MLVNSLNRFFRMKFFLRQSYLKQVYIWRERIFQIHLIPEYPLNYHIKKKRFYKLVNWSRHTFMKTVTFDSAAIFSATAWWFKLEVKKKIGQVTKTRDIFILVFRKVLLLISIKVLNERNNKAFLVMSDINLQKYDALAKFSKDIFNFNNCQI